MKSWACFYLENSAVWVSRSPLREVTQETDLKQPATFSIAIVCVFTQKSTFVIYMKMHVSEWYLHAACYGKCRIALVMFLSHLRC